MNTLYRRPLSADAIAFSSEEGRQVFAEALAAGGLEGYFPLAEQFHTQSDPSFCGLGSLVMALNALAIDPGRLWKGPWRWFAEELLDCCVPLSQVRERGLDAEELACLARCNGAEVELHRADAADLASLRAALTTAARGEAILIASYDRAGLGQTGSGHFSPIGGYHAARDLALVFDVARFKYPPHWVSVERLWQAMQPIDTVTGKARGWLFLRGRKQGIAVGFNVNCDSEGWQGLAQRLQFVRRELLAAADLPSMVRAIVPLTLHLEVRSPSAEAHRAALDSARAALAELAVRRDVENAIGPDRAEAATLLLLAIADLLTPVQREMLEGASIPSAQGPLAAELHSVRAQLAALWMHAQPNPAQSMPSR